MELLQNFEELIRGTAKLEQKNWSNIFGTPLLPRLELNMITKSERVS